jgi:hypothetical protein
MLANLISYYFLSFLFQHLLSMNLGLVLSFDPCSGVNSWCCQPTGVRLYHVQVADGERRVI